MERVFVVASLLAGLSLLTPCGWLRAAANQPEKDIVDTAIAAGSFKTLVTAVKAADLVETLKGTGPFTVFAPTDEAFAAVPKEKLEALLKDKKTLAAVLKYHVVPGKAMAADVVKLDSAKTVQGQALAISAKGGKVRVNGANVVKADIVCGNGVIHVIDTVLLPPGDAPAAGQGFKPTLEAPLPKGWPGLTPVGLVQLKSYPAYRLARTAMSGEQGQDQAFFTLFNHITQNKIAMTTPVEMTIAANGKTSQKESMAFLYQNTELGKPGRYGKVEVVDVPPMTVVSIGVKGDYTTKRVTEARAQLEAWLKVHGGHLEVAGPLRVMGYNSPMVPVDQRYAEVQLPVRVKAAAQ